MTPHLCDHPGVADTTRGAEDLLYSIVVPVYNSEQIVAVTIDRIVAVFTEAGLRYELIVVNDGSPDHSWEVLAAKARANPHITAINLVKNYGQHNANLAGFRASTGDYVITMDDDLQNPPEEALKLIDKAKEGHDVVFGRFESKRASGIRRLGSWLIGMINRRVFDQPDDLVVTNYRILTRGVVDRICADNTAYPYITGQALLYSHRRANVLVRHEPRTVGKSGYNLLKITRLVLTILYSYSLFPLRAAAALGFVVAGVAFLFGAVTLLRTVIGDIRVPGWTSTIVFMAMLNGVTITLLSMLGEYVIRTLNTVSATATYHVREVVSARDLEDEL